MPTPEKPTLKDIAERAGVSVMAVSMALRNRPGVSERTREEIKAIADELGYERDPMLSALSARRKGGKRHVSRIAYVGPWPTDDFLKIGYNQQFFEGATESGKELGYEVAPHWLDPEIPLARHSKILFTRGFDGLLIAPVGEGFERLELDWKRFSSVALGRSLESPRLHFASSNHYGGMQRVCQALWDLGYRRLGLVMRQDTNIRIQGRWAGAFLEFTRTHFEGSPLPPLIDHPLTREGVLGWIQRERPDVVLSLGDRYLGWIEESGLRVPGDIGYVMLERMADVPGGPAFSALDQNLHEVGKAAMKLLHSEITAGNKGIPPIRTSMLIDGTWVRGERV